MGASILDALITQARGAITRAYLVAGVLPALMIVLGWQLYRSRGLEPLRMALEELLTKKTADLSAAVLVRVIAVAVLGALLYGGRGLILHAFQDLPSTVLAFWRRHLLAGQSQQWWDRRRRQALAEQQHTLAGLIRRSKQEQDKSKYLKPRVQGSVTHRLARARAAREHLWRLARDTEAGIWHEENDLKTAFVMDGIESYFSLTPEERADECGHWTELYASPGGQCVVDRVVALLARRSVEALAASSEQPEREEALAPTRLGNRIAVLDDYATSRYGIATNTLWTRLWGALGQSERQEITNAQLVVETMVNMTVAFAALAAAVAVDAVQRGQPYWWGGWFAIGTALLALASYRTAVYAFGGVSDAITRFVDLYRVRVLLSFGLAPPKTFAEERGMFADLQSLFVHADPSRLDLRPMRETKTK